MRLWATARAEPQQPLRRTAPLGSAGASPARPAPLARRGARTGRLTSLQAQRLPPFQLSATYPRATRATHAPAPRDFPQSTPLRADSAVAKWTLQTSVCFIMILTA